jgi:hypothetical protein
MMKNHIISLIFMLLLSETLQAQVSTYTFWSYWGNYTEITSGTLLGTGTALDDNNYNANEIGFTFIFNGTPYTQFSVNANGFLALGASVVSSYTAISTGTTNNVISGSCLNLQGNATAILSYELSGAAGNRVLTVQWKDFRYFGATGDLYNFQVKLYETTNEISLVYGNFIKNAATRLVQVGLRGLSSADFNNRSTSTNWAATTAGVVNTASCYLSGGTLPPDGLTFCFTPSVAGYPLLPNTPFPSNMAVNVPVSGSVNWTFGANSTHYDLWFGPKGNMLKVVDNQPANIGTFTYSPPSLNTSTTYQWQVFEHNGSGTINGPVWSFTTICGASVVPFTESFDTYSQPAVGCGTVLNVNGDAVKWQTKAGDTYSGINKLHIGYNPAGQSHNDWYFTPALSLTGLHSYDVKFYYKGGSVGYVENLEVKWGNAPTVSGMTSPPVFSDLSFYNPGYTVVNTSFTPPVTGTYYLGWHCFSLGDQFGIDVDQVTVDATPVSLQNIVVANGTTVCYDALQTLNVAGGGTTFIVETGGSATMIAGHNICYQPGTLVQPGGYLHGYITTTGEYCSTMQSPVYENISNSRETPSFSVHSLFNIYPNPTPGDFMLEYTGNDKPLQTTVEIYSMSGMKLTAGTYSSETRHMLSVSNLAPGIYFIHVITGKNAEVVKLVKL